MKVQQQTLKCIRNVNSQMNKCIQRTNLLHTHRRQRKKAWMQKKREKMEDQCRQTRNSTQEYLKCKNKCQPQISICHGCSSPTSTRIKLCAAAAAELQHPLKEFRAERGNEALYSRKTGRTGLQKARYSQELIL